MNSNSVIEAIKSRRAVRSFENKPIPELEIQAILDAATYAPSAINIQPWKFVLITSKNEMKKISDIAKPILLRTLPDFGDEAMMGLKQRLTSPEYNVFYNAPLLILVAGAKSLFAVNDCSMAAQNMMLASHSMGIGSCWIGSAVGVTNETRMKASLGIPEDHEVYAAIIFGYPTAMPKAPQKKAAQILKKIN
jgi:nitroreductase